MFPQPNVQSAADLVQHHEVVRHGFVTIQSRNSLYHVNQDQYNLKVLNIALTCVAWTGVAMVSIVVMITDLADISLSTGSSFPDPRWLLPLIALTLVAAAVSGLSIVNCKTIRAMPLFTIINVTVYLLITIIFYWSKVSYQWILALAFSLAQTAIGSIFLKDKKKIIIILLIGLQLVLIGLKLDKVGADISWLSILILPVVIACSAVVGFMIVAIVGGKYYYDHPQQAMTVAGIFYIGLSLLSIGLCIGLLCCRIIFLDNAFGMALGVAVYHFLLIWLFVFNFKDQIALYQAKAQRIAEIQTNIRVEFQKINEPHVFYKVSDNWLSLDKSSIRPIQSEERMDSNIQHRQGDVPRGQCAICLSDPLSLVWMPCGHLAVCQSCGKYLRESSKLSCIICKKKCTQIYHLVQSDSCAGKECRSDFFYRVLQ